MVELIKNKVHGPRTLLCVNLMMGAVWNEIGDGVVNQQEMQEMLGAVGRTAMAA